jgi:hypothetical protein
MTRMPIFLLLAALLLSVLLLGCGKPKLVQPQNLPALEIRPGETLPDLPETLEVTYSDRTTATLPVTWAIEDLANRRIWTDTTVSGTVVDDIGNLLPVTQPIVIGEDDRALRISQQELTEDNWAELVTKALDYHQVDFSFYRDRSVVAYVLNKELVYLWKAGELLSQVVPTDYGPFHDLIWSRDGAYLMAVAATDAVARVNVIDPATGQCRTSLQTLGGAFWSPASSELLIARRTDIELAQAVGDGMAYELAVYDVATGAATVVVPADPTFVLTPVGWDGPDTIVYERVDLTSGTTDTQLRQTIER